MQIVFSGQRTGRRKAISSSRKRPARPWPPLPPGVGHPRSAGPPRRSPRAFAARDQSPRRRRPCRRIAAPQPRKIPASRPCPSNAHQIAVALPEPAHRDFRRPRARAGRDVRPPISRSEALSGSRRMPWLTQLPTMPSSIDQPGGADQVALVDARRAARLAVVGAAENAPGQLAGVRPVRGADLSAVSASAAGRRSWERRSGSRASSRSRTPASRARSGDRRCRTVAARAFPGLRSRRAR